MVNLLPEKETEEQNKEARKINKSLSSNSLGTKNKDQVVEDTGIKEDIKKKVSQTVSKKETPEIKKMKKSLKNKETLKKNSLDSESIQNKHIKSTFLQKKEKERIKTKRESSKEKDTISKKLSETKKSSAGKENIPSPAPVRETWGGISVNLVPEDVFRVVTKDLPERLKYYFLFVIITIGLMIGLWGGLSWMQISVLNEIQETRNTINEKRFEIFSLKSESSELSQLQERYNMTVLLLDNHIYWTKFFRMLEENTIPDVYYTNFSMKSSPGAKVAFNAQAKNIEAVSRQLLVLQQAKDFVTDVSITGFSTSGARTISGSTLPGTVSFDVLMTLHPDVFYKTNE